MVQFQSRVYDYMMYELLLWETTDRDVIIIIYIYTLSKLGKKRRKKTKCVTSLFLNKASSKPTSHDQSLDDDVTVCGFP